MEMEELRQLLNAGEMQEEWTNSNPTCDVVSSAVSTPIVMETGSSGTNLLSLWLFLGAYLFITFSTAQDVRPLSVSSRRRLPTVIITREHLRQRQNSYGVPGDTAAEFVVSAGLDTSKNSAVRIRRIGNRRVNATQYPRRNFNRFDFRNANISGGTGHTDIRPIPQYRTPSFQNANERNNIPDIAINRRYHLNEGHKNRDVIDRRHHLNENPERVRPNGGFYRAPNRNQASPERLHYQYRPPIFVPHYQQNRRADGSIGVPGEANRRPPNVIDVGNRRPSQSSNEQVYPIYSVKYSTSSVSASTSPKQHLQRPVSRPSNTDNLNRKPTLTAENKNKHQDNSPSIRVNNQQLPHSSVNNNPNYYKEKPSTVSNSSDNFYIPSNNPSIYVSKQPAEKPNNNVKNENSKFNENATLNENNNKSVNPSKQKNTHNNVEDEEFKETSINVTRSTVPRNPVVESANPNKNVLAETPPLRSNSVKLHEFQTRLIRKPSLILRDQITVNELPRKSDRPRFGPRSLESADESHSLSRRKRQLGNDNSPKDFDFDDTSAIVNKSEEKSPSNVTNDQLISDSSQRRGRYNFQSFETRNLREENSKKNFSHQRANSSSVTSTMDGRESRLSTHYHPGEQFSDGTYHVMNEESPDGDIMAFSDFIASPMAEKMRLDRQMYFRGANNGSDADASLESFRSNGDRFDSRSLKNNTVMYLRNLITARLLHILNITNPNSNYSNLFKSGRSSEDFNSAEQRHIGIMVSPYEGQESVGSKSSVPVVRVLKGKIVSLPDIPPELIPIILGTYKPTYSEPEEPREPVYHDDPKLTENIIDNAILRLLQNEELLNLQPVIRKAHPIAYKVTRKSPSTNYIGSLKTNDQLKRPNYGFKPNEWSLEPRCDRLTQEICLDDSDYPSSAIMSSIYKDKPKFDLMYAEVKVHESQVEGLSRQQETAYSFEHYYGPYPQASGNNLVTRDYGPHGGFVCPSEVHYARPHRAKNRKGEWKVVVNVGEYTQTMRMEKCLSSGNPCKYVVNHMQSTCSQVYSYHRLLVFSKENGLHIDVFRVPTSCTCHLRPGQKSYNPKHAASAPYMLRPHHYDEYGGHVETAPSPQLLSEGHGMNHDKKKNSFSNTLWAILGGGQQATALAQQPHFLDEVQKQISWTQQLKQFPHLMKQISPNQVLKQLLEEDEEDYSIRRQRVRQKHPMERLTSGGFASHQVPMVVPLPPPPPPPPSTVPRRPVVSATHMDQNHLLSLSPDGQHKIFTISSSPEPTKVFSLTKDSKFIKNYARPIYTIVGPQVFNRLNTYKVRPGMYPPQSENVQIPESSLLPVAPQFNSHSDNHMKPVMKPMPAPQGSNKNIVEDDDLIAAEKSVGQDVQSYAIETVTDPRVIQQEDSDSKINFSYHPILEYLNV